MLTSPVILRAQRWVCCLLLLWLSTIEAVRRTPSSVVSSPQQQQHHKQRQLKHEPVVVPVPNSPDEHLVHSLPLLDDNALHTQHWAGHLPVVEGDKYLFYWLFAPPDGSQIDSNTPLIIWLNGGPACSSMDGLFLENGPIMWELDDNRAYRLSPNPHSWHTAPAYTLYIDQPVGTGLSFTTSGTYPTNDALVNADFYTFLQQFFKLHADKFVTNNKVNRPVYFSGESHAGHYIPSMMHHILKQNENNNHIIIPLAGAAIGNGWVDPYHQYAGARAAYGHGLIDLAQVYKMAFKEQQCQDQLTQGHYTAGVCFDLLDDIVHNAYGTSSQYKVSQYDVRRSEPKQGHRTFPPGYKVTEAYLGGWTLPATDAGSLDPNLYHEVLEALHASAATQAGQRYEECTDPPYVALEHQDGLGVVDDVVAILQHPSQPRLLFFNGIEDLICNHVGNEEALNHLPWQHQKEWMDTKRYAWDAGHATLERPAAGFMREYQNLMYLKLFAAGHMVPMDQPAVALEMMRTLTQKRSFDSSRQDLSSAPQPPDAKCPVCPTCKDCSVCPVPDDDETDPYHDDDGTSNENPASGTSSHSNGNIMTWLGPLLAVGGCLAMVSTCLPRKGKARRRHSGLGLSPQSNGLSSRGSSDRSLELHERQSSNYQDDVVDDKEIL